MKDYRTMTEQERTDWLVRFSAFLEHDYANIKSQGEGWIDSFKRGLKLLQSFTIAEEFVRTSKEFMDYERRIDRMGFFVEEMRRQVIEIDGDVLTRIAVQPKRKVGRPTKEEAREYAKYEQEEQNGKLKALAMIAGVTLPEPEKKPAKEEKTEAVVGDLFGESHQVDTPPKEDPTDTSDRVDVGVDRLRLQDIKHLLSGDLQDAVDTVAMLRSRAATESEMAKELAIKGAPRDEIAKHAKAACDCTNAYEDIYARVDQALAQLYVNTKKSDKYIKYGETKESQLAKTEPYYQKVSKVTKVQDELDGEADENRTKQFIMHNAQCIIKGETAESVESEERSVERNLTGEPSSAVEEKQEQPVMSKADKAALLHRYRTYVMRKDAKITKKRVKRIEHIIAELKEMGVPTDEYEVVLEISKKELGK